MRLPHNAIRDWWHQPVLDRLDAIAEPEPKRPEMRQIHITPPEGTTAADLAAGVTHSLLRAVPASRRSESTCGRDLGWGFEHRIGYYCDRALDHKGPHRAMGEWFDDDGDQVDPPSPGLAKIQELDNARAEPTSRTNSVCMCCYDGLERAYRCRGCRAGFGPDVETLTPRYPRMSGDERTWEPWGFVRSDLLT